MSRGRCWQNKSPQRTQRFAVCRVLDDVVRVVSDELWVAGEASSVLSFDARQLASNPLWRDLVRYRPKRILKIV